MYLCIFKTLFYDSLGQVRNLIKNHHIIDYRRSNPLNLLFMAFIASMDLVMDYDCLCREIRLVEKYVDFPLLCETDYCKLLSTDLLTKKVRPADRRSTTTARSVSRSTTPTVCSSPRT